MADVSCSDTNATVDPTEMICCRRLAVRWGRFAQLHAGRFRREVTRAITTGPLVLEDGSSFVVLAHGHEAGLVFSRRFRPFSKKVWLAWRTIERIAVLPPLVLPSFVPDEMRKHTDAVLTLTEGPVRSITVPWMEEFQRLLPESILLTRRDRR